VLEEIIIPIQKNLSDDQAKEMLDDLLQRNGMIDYIKQNYKL
jgi:hypothetical protein